MNKATQKRIAIAELMTAEDLWNKVDHYKRALYFAEVYAKNNYVRTTARRIREAMNAAEAAMMAEGRAKAAAERETIQKQMVRENTMLRENNGGSHATG